MQNRSYHRYVELLRAAELQSYERTSSRFIATLSSVSAGSWLSRNSLVTFFSVIGALSLVVILMFSAQREDPLSHELMQPHEVILTQSTNVDIKSTESAVEARSIETSSVSERHSINVSSEQEEAGGPVIQESYPVGEISPIQDFKEKEFASISHESPQPWLTPLLAIDERTEHSWSFSLAMEDLPGFDANYRLNLRAGAILEMDNGFAFGFAIGTRSTSERNSQFDGFIDTTFIINGEELPSKIGQYRSSESSVVNVEAGVMASYRILSMSQSPVLAPVLAIFAGLEGKAVVIEQALIVDWMMTDKLSAQAGIALREYPWVAKKMQVQPLIGIRIGL
jgi:hypothetical protein